MCMKNNFYSDKSVLITWLSWFVWSWMWIVLTRMCSHVFWIWSWKSSEEKIEDSINTNFYWTLNILKSFKINTNISHLLIITTDKVYCEDIWYEHHYTENDKLWWNNVYSCGKVLSEKIISFYKEEHLKNRNVLVARPWNILGWLDFSQNRIIPNIMRNIFEWERLHINNSLTKKTFVHILDLISWLLMFIYSKDKWNIHQDILNFGINWNELLTLDEILNIYKERISQDTVFHKWNNDTFVLDSSLANWLLGWKTNYNIEKSLLESFYLYEIFYSSWNIFEEVNLIVDNYFKINKFSFYGPNNNSL